MIMSNTNIVLQLTISQNSSFFPVMQPGPLFYTIRTQLFQKMGNCSGRSLVPFPKNIMTEISQILSEREINMLHLIFKDLSDRVVDRKINLENFLLFFHKNGCWGERLFEQFSRTQENLISQYQFMRGTANIFKASELNKILLLFRFFSKETNEEGILFNDFLSMLYNYPTNDLIQILNDQDFIESQLKNYLIPIQTISKISTANKIDSIKSIGNLKQKYYPNKIINKHNKYYKLQEKKEQLTISSLIGKEVMRNIKDKYKASQKFISLNCGDEFYNIKTINMQQLIKKFAFYIFHSANIDQENGRLDFKKFQHWISQHKALYNNYYNGFHNLIWEDNLSSGGISYLAAKEKTSQARTLIEDCTVKVILFLLHSILVVCGVNDLEMPIMIICLDGLEVSKTYGADLGFGIKISHRNRVYPEKNFYFKNENLMLEWIQLMKYYKGHTIQQKYDIMQKIGAGKFSAVYKCRNILQSKNYALKQIAVFKLEPQARALIAHQSSIMQTISHPLLLQFKQIIQSKTHVYIITELIAGKDLFDFVNDYEELPEYDAAKIALQIIIGVRFLHSLGIVHRDLKPENIMIILDEQSQEVSNIKIIDFGFSRYLQKASHDESDDLLAGTPNYIAPQVLRGDSIGFQMDNFSIGVILYYMLTNTLPFNDYTITDVLKNTMTGQYKFSDKRALSSEAIDLVNQFLKNDPKERISLNTAIKHPWFDIMKQPRKQERKLRSRVSSKRIPF